jgi:hypothetical protein
VRGRLNRARRQRDPAGDARPRGRVLAARRIPITLVGGLLRPDPTGTSAKLVRTLSAQDFPTDHWNIRSDDVFPIPTTTPR